MTDPPLTDELLMAHADGELDAETARRVDDAVAADPALAQRLDLFRRTAALVRAAGAQELEQAVPPGLQSAVLRAVADAPAEAAPRSQGRRSWAWNGRPLAIAAALAAVISGIVGFVAGTTLQDGGRSDSAAEPGVTLALSDEAARAWHLAMGRLPSGEREELPAATAELVVVSSFHDADGSLCREFELHDGAGGLLGVACRPRSQWVLAFAMRTPRLEQGYAPASVHAALEAWLAASGVGPALTPDEERAALRRQ